jgi:hypothetical protein
VNQESTGTSIVNALSGNKPSGGNAFPEIKTHPRPIYAHSRHALRCPSLLRIRYFRYRLREAGFTCPCTYVDNGEFQCICYA